MCIKNSVAYSQLPEGRSGINLPTKLIKLCVNNFGCLGKKITCMQYDTNITGVCVYRDVISC